MKFQHAFFFIIFFSTISFFTGYSLSPSLRKNGNFSLKKTIYDGKKISDFSAIDHYGRFFRLGANKDVKAIVIFVHGIGCPIVEQLATNYEELHQSYKGKSIRFFMINSNSHDKRPQIAQQAKDFKITTPILMDKDQLIAEELGINRTAEVLVIDPHHLKILWRGPLTNQVNFYGKKAQARNFLRETLDHLLDDKPLASTSEQTFGCQISFENPRNKDVKLFHKDIVPILQRKCVFCHRDQGMAPWSMSHYKKIKSWGMMIKEVLLTKRMPPWNADPYYGSFKHDLSLTAEERKTLIHWIENGYPKESHLDEDILPRLQLNDNLTDKNIQKNERVLKFSIPTQVIPANGSDPYKYFKVDWTLNHHSWLRGFSLKAKNKRSIHHILITQLDTLQNVDRSRPPFRLIGLLTPKMHRSVYPKEFGLSLSPKSALRFEIHYTTIGKVVKEDTFIELTITDKKPETELESKILVDNNISISPYSKSHKEQVFDIDQDIYMYSLLPHMHYRGANSQFAALYPDGKSEVLLSIPDYDFNWQWNYIYKIPKFFPKGSKIVCKGDYDNTNNNLRNPDPSQHVKWGYNIRDEMFVCWFNFFKKK